MLQSWSNAYWIVGDMYVEPGTDDRISINKSLYWTIHDEYYDSGDPLVFRHTSGSYFVPEPDESVPRRHVVVDSDRIDTLASGRVPSRETMLLTKPDRVEQMTFAI